jgi:hypothetical protein
MTTGVDAKHWSSERSCSRDSPRLKTLAYRRPSDSSSAVTSTSASLLSPTPDGVSPSDPSPVFPRDNLLPSSLRGLSGNHRTAMPSKTYTDAPQPFGYDRDRPQTYGHRQDGQPPRPHKTEALPTSPEPGELWDKYGTDHSSSHPVRPW